MTVGIVSSALKAVAEQVSVEPDPHKLRQLVTDINMLLDVVERRVLEIDECSSPSKN